MKGAVGKQQPVIRESKKTSSFLIRSARLGGERPSCGGGYSMTKTCGKFPVHLLNQMRRSVGYWLQSNMQSKQHMDKPEGKEDHVSSWVQLKTAAGQGCPPSNFLGYEMHLTLENISKSNCNEP